MNPSAKINYEEWKLFLYEIWSGVLKQISGQHDEKFQMVPFYKNTAEIIQSLNSTVIQKLLKTHQRSLMLQ